MITASRTGGSLMIRDRAGQMIGSIGIPDLGLLVSSGESVPLKGIDAITGYVTRERDTCTVTLADGSSFTCAWHEFRACALIIGSSVTLTGPETKAKSGTGAVTAPTPGKGPDKEYIPVPAKRLKPRPDKLSSFTRQAQRPPPVRAAGRMVS